MADLNFFQRLQDEKDPAKTASNFLLLAAGVLAAIVILICLGAVGAELWRVMG